jgi:hypothetical protein
MPLILQGATSGQATVQATDAQTVTITLPATSGTLVTTGGAQTIEFADGSASAPSITNSGDTNTGMFFPAADTIAFTEGGTESMRIDSSGIVAMGTTDTSNTTRLKVQGGATAARATSAQLTIQRNTVSTQYEGICLNAGTASAAFIGRLPNNDDIIFGFDAGASLAERMRLGSNGALLVGTTAEPNNANNGFKTDSQYTIMASSGQIVLYVNRNANTGEIQQFRYNNSAVGNVSTNGSNCTFNSTSDYRLKENIAPMTGALDKVAQLKPVTYQWKKDGQDGEGFIAHELAEVCPEAVTGEKDAVELVDIKDEEGNVIGQEEKPVYQAIDQSVLVATLTAAIQELKATVDAQAARIAALETQLDAK